MKINAHKNLWHGLTALTGSLLVLFTGGYKAASMMEARINFMLGTFSNKVVELDKTQETDSVYYKSDFKSAQELVDFRENLNREIVAEGAVLLKNNSTLPLDKGAHVTMLGIGGVSPVYSGASGGGIIKNTDQIYTLKEAFAADGININPVVHDWYVNTGIPETCLVPVTGFDGTTTIKGPWENQDKEFAARKSGVTEADASKAFASWKTSYDTYKDAAIVWLCRYEGEGADIADGEFVLTQEEKSLLAEAKSNFDKVIVILNGSAIPEIDELAKDPRIDSILWVSELGTHGTLGLADVITGKVSPSGHLADTIARDNTTSPAYQNHGAFFFENAGELGLDYFGSTYLVQAEGIYVGYKYYETRYEDSVLKQGNASADNWTYAGEVTYPFGYGLSYSDFTQSLDNVDVDYNAGTITATVTVKNTGNVKARDVVQLYAQSPYTDYDIANKVEKSSVQLIAFDKTKELLPGESETITVKADMKYLASYDYVNAKTYILDAGNYFFAIGNGAHDALNNILSAKGKTTADGMDYNGKAGLASAWNNADFDSQRFSKGYDGLTEITNQFASADLNTWISDSVTYLSRSDWKATWPKAYWGIRITDEMLPWLKSEQYTPGDKDTSSLISGSTDTNYSLISLRGVEYLDTLWEDVLNQISSEEMAKLITDACEHTAPVMSVQYKGSLDKDGPVGYDATFNTDKNAVYHIENESSYIKNYNFASLCTQPLLAASFNPELAAKRGYLNGEDSLWSGYTVNWAPGANLHRTQYSGRNYEYFSEDPMLTNIMSSLIVKETQKKGAVSSPKHFAGNDQETNRNGVATFYNEQGLREEQLRAFEGAFTPQEGNAHCTMTSFSRIGLKQAAYSQELLTNVLRGEWGFDGYTITDFAFSNLMYPYASLTAGTDAFDNMISDYSAINDKALDSDLKLKTAARQATHRILYTYVNSNAMNGVSNNTKIVKVIPWWKGCIIAFMAINSILCAASAVLSIVSIKSKRS